MSRPCHFWGIGLTGWQDVLWQKIVTFMYVKTETMDALAIREKLYDYIRVADDKKIEAIYIMLEDNIKERLDWWKDKMFVDVLQKEQKAWVAGETKGYSMSEIKSAIANRKKKT
ncbi:MAG: hypothetical protein LCH51_03340 [Bacteroidetes bacterium]|nr:hypothetical protein [Bacteroidota bacterium]